MAATKRILGIDYGTKRIGIAVSDPLGIIASGVKAVANSQKGLSEIKELISLYDPEKIVIGLPLNLKGEAGAAAEGVEVFIEKLGEITGLEIVRRDERFTSAIAHRTRREMNVKRKDRRSKEDIDIISAALILQSYLDEMASHGRRKDGEAGG